MAYHSKAETQGRKTKLWRINKDGFYEEITFTGSLYNKPYGWKVKRG